jgi:polar amino acid transport system substrate-binding protein
MLRKIISAAFLLMAVSLNPMTVLSSDVFVLSGNPYAPPVVWEENKQLRGVAPDIARAILDELSIPYSMKVLRDWEVVQQAAKSGTVDLIVSAYKNDQRSAYLNFSIPYLAQQTVILVEKGKEFKLKSWSSLQGKKGVTGVGESYGQKFDAFIAENLEVSYLPLERAIKTLNLGKADYLIIDLYTALIYTYLLQGEDAVTILDPPVTVESFHLAIAKDSPLTAHLDAINQKLEEKIASGAVKELLITYFDQWQKKITRQSAYMQKLARQNSADQEQYLKKQGEMARQSLLGAMTQREGLPVSVE